jgi:hypothetical protein
MVTVEQVRVVRRKLFIKLDGKWYLIACGVTNTMYVESMFVATVQSSIFANKHIITIEFGSCYVVRRIVVDSNNIILEENRLTAKQVIENDETMDKEFRREFIESDIAYLEELDNQVFVTMERAKELGLL